MTKTRNKKTNTRKKREIVLPLYFGYRIRIALERMKQIKKQIISPFKKRWQYFSAVFALILIVAVLVFENYNLVYAATYTFSQSSWAGGVSGDTLTHPTSSSTNYASASNMVLAENSVALSTTTNTFTQTSDTDFAGGTFSSTQQNGTIGSGASVRLPTTSTTNFSYTGTVRSYTVPAGATSIRITGKGAGGGV